MIFLLLHQVPIVHIDRGQQNLLRVLIDTLDQQLSILQRDHVSIGVEGKQLRHKHPVRRHHQQIVFHGDFARVDRQIAVLLRTSHHIATLFRHGGRNHGDLGREKNEPPTFRLHFDFHVVLPDLFIHSPALLPTLSICSVTITWSPSPLKSNSLSTAIAGHSLLSLTHSDAFIAGRPPIGSTTSQESRKYTSSETSESAHQNPTTAPLDATSVRRSAM